MMISLLSFGLSWIVYALVFYALAAAMPHTFLTGYREVLFQLGFFLGLVDAGLLRVVRVANFKIHWIVLGLVLIALDYALISGSNGSMQDLVITSKGASLLVATVLGCFAIAFDLVKNRLLANTRL